MPYAVAFSPNSCHLSPDRLSLSVAAPFCCTAVALTREQPARPARIKKIAQQLRTVRREHTFRVKLHTCHRRVPGDARP
jgi:hypothetical protein